MKQLVRLLRQPEFQVFLFCILFMLINWPFLGISASRGLMGIFSYLFILWGILIVVIFLMQRALRGESGRDEQGRK